MSLTAKEIMKLKRLISLAQELVATAESTSRSEARGKGIKAGKRVRRTGKELAAFRKMLKAERKNGVRVEEIARRHGVSTAYIYQLGG